VPPYDPKGDVRLGYQIAGGLFIVLGWGFGVVVNLLLHRYAPSGGHRIENFWIGPSMGPYAWAIAGLGAVAGVLGVWLLALSRTAPKGPFVLPGVES